MPWWCEQSQGALLCRWACPTAWGPLCPALFQLSLRAVCCADSALSQRCQPLPSLASPYEKMSCQISRRIFLIKIRRQSLSDYICENYEVSENSLFLEVCSHWRDARQSPCASARWQMSVLDVLSYSGLVLDVLSYSGSVLGVLSYSGSLCQQNWAPVPLILLAAHILGVSAVVFP